MTCSMAFGADATSTKRNYAFLSLRISFKPLFATKQSRRETAQSCVHRFKSKPSIIHRTRPNSIAQLITCSPVATPHQRVAAQNLATIPPFERNHADSVSQAAVRNGSFQPRRFSMPMFHSQDSNLTSPVDCRLVDRKVTGTIGFVPPTLARRQRRTLRLPSPAFKFMR